MAYAAGGALAAEVSLAGGFGFIGVGSEPVEKVRKELIAVRQLLDLPRDANVLPIGVGFLGWILDQKEALSKEELIPLIFEYRVQAIWLSFGTRLGSWIEYVRSLTQKTGHNIQVFVQVSSLDEAQTAIKEWKADVIVAQGTEAGGHGASQGLPLLTLLPLILSATDPNTRPAILGAGGLADGTQLAALLTLGASGAVFGTRFLLAPQSLYTDRQRQVLLAADASKSIRTMAFDEARGSTGWPAGIDGRGIRNATVEDYESGLEASLLRDKYAAAAAKGDTDRIIVWSGTGVGSMTRIQPAKDIVRELHDDCLGRLNDARNLIKA
ncbi:2-nitropropane dioxygenase [Coprinellus micaceus]|uniref:2-nitropropane dioxygenase n=1 Tax=Coprinellus micaceus TaxID=71717 RepID=A0A4Y7TQN2_COPMI|nr:2-nitropropane dioxygenase [Coprinellus micaceus]